MPNLRVFRLVFGLYLAVHFVHLLPYATEVFGAGGMLESARLNGTYGIFPNLLSLIGGSRLLVEGFVGAMAAAALMMCLEPRGKLWAVGIPLFLWYGWACLFNSNNLILNPSLPYVGWLLLAMAVLGANPDQRNRTILVRGAWILLGLGYFISGWAKLKSPSWQNGDALLQILNNPLARDYFLRDWLAALPAVLLKAMTYFVLFLELAFPVFVFKRRTRFPAWAAMVGLHVGIALTVSFADLTFGMLLIHLFVFDPDWVRGWLENNGNRDRRREMFQGMTTDALESLENRSV
jgi:hypothetical protein